MRASGQIDPLTIIAVDPRWRDNRNAMEFPFLRSAPELVTMAAQELG
jgi:hypothetical protein